MAQKQRSLKREEHVIRIGPQLKALIDEQIDSIKDVTYGVSKSSPWEAGEIIALKMKGKV